MVSLNQQTKITRPTSLETGDVGDVSALLHQFEAVSLGEGSIAAGGNTLAAMALTLANIAPPGSCLSDNEGTRVQVGMNLLVNGGLSCSLISDRVIVPLQKLQGNIFGHIVQRVERRNAEDKRISDTNAFLGKEQKGEPAPPCVLDRLEKDAQFNETYFARTLRHLLHPPAHSGVAGMTETPVIFAGIGSMDGLSSSIGFANRGRLLAHVSLSGKNAADLLDQVCDEVLSGCPKRKMLTAGFRGEVIATDRLGMLGGLLAERTGHGWLERMLWLVEHEAGPEMEIAAKEKNETQLGWLADRFDAAVEEMFVTRLNYHKQQPVIIEYPVASGQAGWNDFLAKLEPRFPGITGTLRPLWASLLFGLWRIYQEVPSEGRPPFADAEVDAFARVLALRMVNAREVILEENHRKLIEAIATSMRIKLMEGPHTRRELMRRFDKLDVDTCLAALELLADSGIVVCRAKKWQLADSRSYHTLTLDA